MKPEIMTFNPFLATSTKLKTFWRIRSNLLRILKLRLVIIQKLNVYSILKHFINFMLVLLPNTFNIRRRRIKIFPTHKRL